MSAKVKRDIAGLAALAVAAIYLWYGEGNPQLQKILFVIGWAAVWIRYRNCGLGHEQIRWPDSLAVVMYLYKISLIVLQVVFFGVGLVGLLWVMDMLPLLPDSFWLQGGLAIIMVVLPFCLSLLSECWNLHDKWALRAGNDTIDGFMAAMLGHDRGVKKFDKHSWLFIDLFLLLMLGFTCMSWGEPLPQEDKWEIWLGWAYADFLLLQGYLYIRYRKEGL